MKDDDWSLDDFISEVQNLTKRIDTPRDNIKDAIMRVLATDDVLYWVYDEGWEALNKGADARKVCHQVAHELSVEYDEVWSCLGSLCLYNKVEITRDRKYCFILQ